MVLSTENRFKSLWSKAISTRVRLERPLSNKDFAYYRALVSDKQVMATNYGRVFMAAAAIDQQRRELVRGRRWRKCTQN